MISLADVTDTPLLKPPAKLFGFTYISVFLEKLSLASPVKLAQPALTMSVFCPKGRPVETAQVRAKRLELEARQWLFRFGVKEVEG